MGAFIALPFLYSVIHSGGLCGKKKKRDPLPITIVGENYSDLTNRAALYELADTNKITVETDYFSPGTLKQELKSMMKLTKKNTSC